MYDRKRHDMKDRAILGNESFILFIMPLAIIHILFSSKKNKIGIRVEFTAESQRTLRKRRVNHSLCFLSVLCGSAVNSTLMPILVVSLILGPLRL